MFLDRSGNLLKTQFQKTQMSTSARNSRLRWVRDGNFVILFSKGAALTPENIGGVLAETPPLINESDLHISQVSESLV